jgi:hypothetical protein
MVIVSFVDAKFQGCGETVEDGGGSLVKNGRSLGEATGFFKSKGLQVLFRDLTSSKSDFLLTVCGP